MKFQEQYTDRMDSVAPNAEFLHRLNARMDEAQAGRLHRKSAVALALIFAALLALTTGALAASGALDTLFSHFSSRSKYNFDHIDTHSAHAALAETLRFSNGATASVLLEQAYYNGEQLALAWRLDSDPEQLYFIDQTDFSSSGTQSIAFGFYPWISEEARAEFERRYAEDGFACVSYLQCYFDDSLYLLSAEDLPADPAAAYDAFSDYEFLGMREMGDTDTGEYVLDISTSGRLPDSLRDQPSLPVTRYVSGTVYYFYRDSTGQYSGTFPKEHFPVSAAIPRTDDFRQQEIRQRVELPNHTADIILKLSPIQARLRIQNWISDDWQQAWDAWWPENAYSLAELPLNLPEDVIVQYRIFIDGEPLGKNNHWYDASGLTAEFILPADAQTITLRPVYANSGEHPDEDILLSLSE